MGITWLEPPLVVVKNECFNERLTTKAISDNRQRSKLSVDCIVELSLSFIGFSKRINVGRKKYLPKDDSLGFFPL